MDDSGWRAVTGKKYEQVNHGKILKRVRHIDFIAVADMEPLPGCRTYSLSPCSHHHAPPHLIHTLLYACLPTALTAMCSRYVSREASYFAGLRCCGKTARAVSEASRTALVSHI